MCCESCHHVERDKQGARCVTARARGPEEQRQPPQRASRRPAGDPEGMPCNAQQPRSPELHTGPQTHALPRAFERSFYHGLQGEFEQRPAKAGPAADVGLGRGSRELVGQLGGARLGAEACWRRRTGAAPRGRGTRARGRPRAVCEGPPSKPRHIGGTQSQLFRSESGMRQRG